MFALILAATIGFTPADAHFAYEKAGELVERHTPRDAGTFRGRQAANYILDETSAAGANVRRDTFTALTPTGERTFTNLYAEFGSGGESNRWVIVVSHYDTKPGSGSPGANDGASTTGLLMALAKIASESRNRLGGNLMLVWTDGEECRASYGENDGLWGARRAVEYVRAKGRNVQAVICVDMIGDSELNIIVPENVSPTLAEIALHAARRAGLAGVVTRSHELVKDDHLPFLEAGYKAIVLIDFDYGPNNAYWHTPQDTLDKVSEASLLKSGRILAELVNILL